jgi:hypothetical protein
MFKRQETIELGQTKDSIWLYRCDIEDGGAIIIPSMFELRLEVVRFRASQQPSG